MRPVILRTERLRIRPERLSDVPSFYAHIVIPEVRRHLPLPERLTPETTRAYLAKFVRQWRRKRPESFGFSITLEPGGDWIGGINLRFPSPGVGEIGYSLHPDFWGKGYMAEAAGRIVEWGFAAHGLHRIQATCDAANRRSAKVLRRLGMRREGRLRDYRKVGKRLADQLVFGITRDAWMASRLKRGTRA